MRKISVFNHMIFNHMTVDGFFAGLHGEMDWFMAIKKDDVDDAYTHEQSSR
jgi:hypothetical protein